MKLAERILALRKQNGKTQTELAEYLGLKLRAYQYYENGRYRPDYEKLIALAAYYGVSTDYLLGLTDEREPYPGVQSDSVQGPPTQKE